MDLIYDWISNNWMAVAVILYAALSEIIGISPLKSNSVVQIIMTILGKLVGKGKVMLLLFVLLTVLGLQMFAVSPARAASSITFAWDQSSGAAGYYVYQSASNSFDKTKTKVCSNVTALTCTVKDVPDGLYYYAATAYDTAGNESDFSNSVSYNGDTTPPVVPQGFKISVITTITVTQ